jgi:hypothetical protein
MDEELAQWLSWGKARGRTRHWLDCTGAETGGSGLTVLGQRRADQAVLG